MTQTLDPTQVVFQELYCANNLLDDPAALNAAWERDGYWYFQDVLDREVIARIRQTYVNYLVDMGVVDAGDSSARYNGADITGLPINIPETRLNDMKAHKLLHESPAINGFFARLFGCNPFWVPFTVHRTNPPEPDSAGTRFDFIHEDGVYNDGLDFLICWVPIDEIDEDVGGIAVVEGVHKGPCLHRKEGAKILPMEVADVPPDRWRRTNYRPGDVLLMGLRTPHSGLKNISRDGRFRLSMDTRVMPSKLKVPIVGTVSAVDSACVTIEDSAGVHVLRFDSDSFVRGFYGDRMPLPEIPARYAIGTEVIASTRGDLVINLRPQT